MILHPPKMVFEFDLSRFHSVSVVTFTSSARFRHLPSAGTGQASRQPVARAAFLLAQKQKARKDERHGRIALAGPKMPCLAAGFSGNRKLCERGTALFTCAS
jgi:hypothetical protein